VRAGLFLRRWKKDMNATIYIGKTTMHSAEIHDDFLSPRYDKKHIVLDNPMEV
jgi:hypothetical protein